jgi:hypothetical protein
LEKNCQRGEAASEKDGIGNPSYEKARTGILASNDSIS